MKRLLWPVTSVYWLALFVLTHIPSPQMPKVDIGDKAAHLIAYFLLASLLYVSFRKSRVRKVEGVTLLVCVAYGAIDEWLQALPLVNRSCELYDWFADCTGVAIGVAVVSLLLRRK